MLRITIDDALKSQLHGTDQPLVLCDAEGSALGHFVPIVPTGGQDDCPYSDEQLRKMRSESGGRTWPEIRDSLEQS